jgi:predicted porin
MKKHLIAAAVAGALAVPAMAQVTISGALEAGYISKKNADKSTNSTVDTIVGTPNITFKGSEDLGGGLKAGFTLKQNIDTPTGAQSNFAQSQLDLSGGFGKISLGRFDAAGRDFGGVYRFFGDIGRLVSSMNPGGDTVNNFMYTTPKFNGFSAAFSDSRGGGRTTISAAAEKVSSYILQGDIAGFKVAYAATEIKAANTGATSEKVTGLAGSYDFKIAKVGVVSAKREDTGNNDVKVLGLHAAAPVGPVTLGFSQTTYEESDNNKETKIMALAAKYSLSKRTAVFATWQKISDDASGNANDIGSTRGLSLALPTTTGATSNTGYGISVEHKF